MRIDEPHVDGLAVAGDAKSVHAGDVAVIAIE